jgi:DNA polymerase type B, organellar and viral
MDGATGSIGSCHASVGRKRLASAGKIVEPERHDIFVRAHTSVRSESDYRRVSPKWPRHCLIFDTETTLDTAQRLNFGAFRRCKRVGSKYVCVAEGILHRDDLTKAEANVLQKYKDDPPTIPEIENFPAQTQLSLQNRSEFVSTVFWKSVRNGELIVCFNLPFDLSRLAVSTPEGEKGGWSLALADFWKNPKTGRVVPNPKRPRIVVDAQNSKMAFVKLGSILHPKEWPNEERFLDLRTLGWAIRSVSYGLKSACKNFDVQGKFRHEPTGKITPEEIEYCRGDVAATHRLLNAMMEEFNRNPLDLHPDKAYSPASVAKAYLEEMKIKKPRQHFRAPNKMLGIAMQSYYGGRAECRIRKTPVPVIHTDFTSQYPTVNALMGNWNVLTSASVRFRTCTARARQLLARTEIDDTFDPALWKQMNFFALVKPQSDLLPIRTVYGETGRTKNIGLNYLSSETPIWYAAPDLIASKILNGKAPHILRAIELIPSGRQNRLMSTNLGGMVKIEPAKQDFYREVIQQRASHKKTDEGLSNFLKVLANSGSYGLFVEVNTETKKKERAINYFSGEMRGQVDSNYTEKPGKWYFPPLASLITSGGRLLLAMLEKSVEDKGGSYLFCDTDSLCIVGTKNGSFVPCPGGKFRLHGIAGFNALSLREIEEIADKFKRLNPYDPSLVSEILKIEDVNFEDSDLKKPFRQLYGYSISAKRYALYSISKSNIQIEKASGHGLGYLLAPKERRKDEDEETPQWVIEAWKFLLQKELKLPVEEPRWLDLPAMMRMVVTTPNVFKHQRPEWLAPFNFFLFPIVSPLVGQPVGYENSKFVFITPYESDRRKWKSLTGVNLGDGKDFQIAMRPTANQDKVIPDSFRKVLHSYLSKPEVKSLAPDGTPCTGETRGLLLRAEITAGNLIPVGKETDRHWEHGEDPSMVDPQSYVYEKQGNMVVADASDRKSWSAIGVRRLMRESKLSQAPVSNTINGKPVRRQTLSVIRQAADKIKA